MAKMWIVFTPANKFFLPLAMPVKSLYLYICIDADVTSTAVFRQRQVAAVTLN
jgi:hypothetical protein